MRILQNLKPSLLAFLFFLTTAAQAQVAMYQGADRTQRLVDGARAEGTLSIYTSMAPNDMNRLISAFEKKYPIKINVWRSGTDKVLQRVVAEGRSGHSEVDLVLNTSPEMEAIYREKLLQPVYSPMQKNLIDAAMPAHREYVGMRIFVYLHPYNTKKIKKEELPRTYEDLLNPRWKNQLGMEAKHEWFYTLIQYMGEEKGLRFFRDLVATNGLKLHTGSSVVANMVAAGEVPLALNIYMHVIQPLRDKGADIDYFTLSPTIAATDAIAILRKAPHPHAAILFYDFCLNEGQQIIADDTISTNHRDDARLAKFQPLVFIDPAKALDSYTEWDALFLKIMKGQ
jgi:iron(III) transport system substrate-binding protein